MFIISIKELTLKFYITYKSFCLILDKRDFNSIFLLLIASCILILSLEDSSNFSLIYCFLCFLSFIENYSNSYLSLR